MTHLKFGNTNKLTEGLEGNVKEISQKLGH